MPIRGLIFVEPSNDVEYTVRRVILNCREGKRENLVINARGRIAHIQDVDAACERTIRIPTRRPRMF